MEQLKHVPTKLVALYTNTLNYKVEENTEMAKFRNQCCFISSCALVALTLYMFRNGTQRTKLQTIRQLERNVDTLPGLFTKCTPRTKTALMSYPLSVNSYGEVDLNEIETSGCFKANPNKSGIYRIIHGDNFKDTKCLPVQRRFLNVTGREIRTALASIPGSGNTWTRHLIEEITGIYSGSFYASSISAKVFKGDRRQHNVIVVKTHIEDIKLYDRAVVLVRDPFEFTLSEFNRLRVSKTGIIPESQFDSIAFKESLEKKLNATSNKVVGWINNFKGDLFMLYYDKLKTDLPNSLLKLAWFLKSEVNLERLWCTVLNKEGSFKRKEEKPEYMSRKVLVNTETEIKIQKWKQAIQEALMRRSLPWSSS